jgi:hypothetical protein
MQMLQFWLAATNGVHDVGGTGDIDASDMLDAECFFEGLTDVSNLVKGGVYNRGGPVVALHESWFCNVRAAFVTVTDLERELVAANRDGDEKKGLYSSEPAAHMFNLCRCVLFGHGSSSP